MRKAAVLLLLAVALIIGLFASLLIYNYVILPPGHLEIVKSYGDIVEDANVTTFRWVGRPAMIEIKSLSNYAGDRLWNMTVWNGDLFNVTIYRTYNPRTASYCLIEYDNVRACIDARDAKIALYEKP